MLKKNPHAFQVPILCKYIFTKTTSPSIYTRKQHLRQHLCMFTHKDSTKEDVHTISYGCPLGITIFKWFSLSPTYAVKRNLDILKVLQCTLIGLHNNKLVISWTDLLTLKHYCSKCRVFDEKYVLYARHLHNENSHARMLPFIYTVVYCNQFNKQRLPSWNSLQAKMSVCHLCVQLKLLLTQTTITSYSTSDL